MIRELDPGEYYHVLNRGVGKNDIFLDDADRRRFLFLLLYFQAPTISIPDVSAMTKEFKITPFIRNLADDVISQRTIELICFSLMNNHFHICVREKTKSGISKFMQRVLNSYTKYFNTRYELSGHLFQGPYKIVHVENDTQLLYVSAYIHRNPRDLPGMRGKEAFYPWSSYQDYTRKNRWGELLLRNIILDQFDSQKEYADFLKTSTAKLLEGEWAIE